MLPTNNSYSSTSNPHAPSEPLQSTGTQRLTSGRRRDPPLRNVTGGHPPRGRPVPGHRCYLPRLSSPPPFLPPALSLVHPALYLLTSILVLLTPVRNSVSLPPPPPLSPPDGDNHPVHVVVPTTHNGGGGQNTVPCHSRDHAATLSGTSTQSSLVVVIVGGESLGRKQRWWWLPGAEAAAEEAAAAVIMTFLCCAFGVAVATCRDWCENGSFLLKCQKTQRMQIVTELYKYACKLRASSVQAPCKLRASYVQVCARATQKCCTFLCNASELHVLT